MLYAIFQLLNKHLCVNHVSGQSDPTSIPALSARLADFSLPSARFMIPGYRILMLLL